MIQIPTSVKEQTGLSQPLLPLSVASLAGSASDYPRQSSLIDLFESAAAQHSERIALSFGGAEISYAELNRRANQVAHRLIRAGAAPESFVAIYIERSIEMIAGILGTLKAGCVYVPLDASYPRERVHWMLADAKAAFLLADRNLPLPLESLQCVSVIRLDDRGYLPQPGDEQNPPQKSSATSLAYVMYTSGSTGRPKGVMVEHRSVVRLVINSNYCKFGPDEVFLQLAPISFDASTFEIWGALLHGAKLVVMPPQAPSLQEIGEHIRQHHVSTLWLTAGLFHIFVDQRIEDLRSIRQLLAGGDSLSATHVRKVLQSFPEIILINGYGPTENTTFTCCHAMRSGDTIANSVSIGRPISNTYVYVLDDHRQPLALGEVGELYAGGDGVARGYLNSPELTAEKFFADPFFNQSGARLYRTGDLARWLPDGTLEFLGRRDSQVKILGHRIELGEIEAFLEQHPAVQRSCVIVKTDSAGTKRLAAFYVRQEGSCVEPAMLKTFLAEKLPSYMVPGSLTAVPEIPLTANGKVDREALANLSTNNSAPPPAIRGSDVEEKIADIWKKTLGTQHVGLDDNFFDLGGDSLLIVAVHAQLQDALQRELRVVDLFEYATIRSLARHIGEIDRRTNSFSAAQEQARKQREAIARRRSARGNAI